MKTLLRIRAFVLRILFDLWRAARGGWKGPSQFLGVTALPLFLGYCTGIRCVATHQDSVIANIVLSWLIGLNVMVGLVIAILVCLCAIMAVTGAVNYLVVTWRETK